MKDVLIMGGSYFIGRAIAERLSRSMNVTLLNRGSRCAPDGVRQITCDRSDCQKLTQALTGKTFDCIVDVCGLHQDHAQTLCHALNNPKSLKSLIFISSSAVYDVEHLDTPFKESDRLARNRFWNEYGTDKIAAEQAYLRFFTNNAPEVRTVFLRPPYVYGENNYARRESFVFDHITGGRPVIIPKSTPKLQFIYAPDLAEIIAALIEKSDQLPIHSVFNAGNSAPVTCREWVEACGRAAGMAPDIIEYDYAAAGRNVRDFFPFFDYDNILDVSKIKRICPNETPFDAGLRNAFQWFTQNRQSITFYPHIAANEAEILASLPQA